ncbi:MAG: nucleotidyltransferase [Methyloligella sp.]|jgi:hypothetical protein|nr:MAG: nucleotidyltransferase [Methyloligella sp.]
MKTTDKNIPSNPFEDIAEALLADVAISVQLPPGKHKMAIERSEALQRHMEREGSPLQGLIALFYAQGSMATGTTINARLKNDEFDIDKVAEILLPPGTPPAYVLNLLYKSIRGEPGSKYYDMTERRTRCITIHYADGMHVDITPMILTTEVADPRTSWLFHAHEDEPLEKHETLLGNPWGFAEYFNENMQLDPDFAKAFGQRSMQAEFLLDADSEPVPDPEPAYLKSLSVVALQLLKRHRNVVYDNRTGRMPSTVMISCMVVDVTGRAKSLSEELLVQARYILRGLKDAQARNQLIDVSNPRCHEDKFTDRWPGNLQEQGQFIGDLNNFVEKIKLLRSGDLSLDEMGKLLESLFGESPAKAAVNRYIDRLAKHGEQNRIAHNKNGRISLISAGASIASTPAIAKPNTFYGGAIKE